MRLPLLVFLSILQATALKFLAYNPGIGTSHFTYISRVVEALVEAGHDVVMLAPQLTEKVKIVETKGARIIKDVKISDEAAKIAESAVTRMIDLVWTYKSDLDFAELVVSHKIWYAMIIAATLQTPGLLERLKAEKFDAAFAEPVDLCGFGAYFHHLPGIFHLIGIKSYAMMLSVSTTEGTFDVTGAPTVPSYVPGTMADFGERMTFFQRVINTVTLGFLYVFFRFCKLTYNPLFIYDVQRMHAFIQNILKNSSLFFPNCEPLTDFPRPTSHKIVEIGGITVSGGRDLLDEKWSSILDARPKTVLLSFGTGAQAYMMPESYKNAIREMIAAFPEVTFIVKYEKAEDGFSKSLPNVVEGTWLPQRALLKDARLSAFFTHGGAGSTTEATHAGVPLIVVPIMGDQLRNGRLIERLGTGIKLDKDSLASSADLISAMTRILDEKSFKPKAKIAADQLRQAPFSPREKLVRNMEFMAKFGPLTQLDHYGTQLYTFQYYLIDVFAFLTLVVIVVL
ncbi:hypothetical protein PMAYCL1PPCAC_16373, partial [Pristionchus mayeri]